MAYQPLSSLPSLFNQTSTPKQIGGVLQPTQAQSAASATTPTTTSGGFIYDSLGRKIGHTSTPTSTVGVKTQSPTDNIKAPTNTTSQPKVTAPIQTTKSTDNGTQATGMNTANTQQYSNQSTQQAQPTFDQNNSGLYGQIIATLANRSTQSGQDYRDAQAEAQRISDQQTALAKDYAQKDRNIQGTAGFLTQATGLEGQLNRQYGLGQDALAQQYAGATNRLGAANTQQGLLQQALQQAGSLAQPQLGNIGSQQYYNPVNGGQNGGNTGSAMSQLPQQAQSAIQSYAQQVKNGQMTRPDAESRFAAYGITGTNALNEALGSNFNTNSSNASAGTTATGQQIKTAADSTNKALDTLSSAFSNLSGFSTGGIPATNSLAQWIGTQFGSSALSQYKTNLADARSQLIGVLNSSGGTPTSNVETANQYLPDNMTKAQFDANVGTAQNPGIVRQLVAQKVGSFTGSGTQNNSSSNGSVITTPSGLTINTDF